ncbi:hypothetical protein M8J77_010526 [Diaphorina citri]|nr:hypothetical protein M8J77_010526 [Diaphorina citri]
MCTQHFVNSINKWEVLNEPSMADHQHISLEIVGTGIEQATYRDPRRTDWTGFRQTIVETIGPVNTNISGHRDLDEYAEHLQNSIKSSYEANNTPIVKTFKGKARWWNKTLAKMRANVRKLFRIAMKYNVWAGYKSALNEYNMEVRKAKRASFRNYCGSIENTAETSRLSKVLKSVPINTMGTLLNSQEEYTKTGKETLRVLLDCHFPGSQINTGSPGPTQWSRPTREGWKFARWLITPSSIKWAIQSFGPFKSPGVDGILPCMLQEAQEELTPHLTYIFRASIAMGYLPYAWRLVKVNLYQNLARNTMGKQSRLAQ